MRRVDWERKRGTSGRGRRGLKRWSGENTGNQAQESCDAKRRSIGHSGGCVRGRKLSRRRLTQFHR